MPEPTSRQPSPPLRWWEGLETWKQVVIAGPLLSLLLFVLNWGPMSQPAERSVGYGILEGIFFTALLIVATRHERSKRERSAADGDSEDTA
jgi:hypothetical protein